MVAVTVLSEQYPYYRANIRIIWAPDYGSISELSGQCTCYGGYPDYSGSGLSGRYPDYARNPDYRRISVNPDCGLSRLHPDYTGNPDYLGSELSE
jgi:hypothetical protein